MKMKERQRIEEIENNPLHLNLKEDLVCIPNKSIECFEIIETSFLDLVKVPKS
jgi:hypothetical protein